MSNPPLYDNNPRNDLILQGDIFPEIDFLVVNTEFNPERSLAKQVIPKRLVAIISQTCDTKENDSVVISPIYNLDEYIEMLKQKGESANKISSNVGYIKSRKSLLDKFYLQNLEITKGNVQECFIDLLQMKTVSKSLFTIDKRISSLSHWGRHLLDHQLSWVYGRPVIEW